VTTTRELFRAQLNQAGELLRKARVELERTAAEPALFTPEPIHAARARVIEAQHRFAQLQDAYHALFC
jgi:hypothetical protein